MSKVGHCLHGVREQWNVKIIMHLPVTNVAAVGSESPDRTRAIKHRKDSCFQSSTPFPTERSLLLLRNNQPSNCLLSLLADGRRLIKSGLKSHLQIPRYRYQDTIVRNYHRRAYSRTGPVPASCLDSKSAKIGERTYFRDTEK